MIVLHIAGIRLIDFRVTRVTIGIAKFFENLFAAIIAVVDFGLLSPGLGVFVAIVAIGIDHLVFEGSHARVTIASVGVGVDTVRTHPA